MFDTPAPWSFWVAPHREICQKREHPECRGKTTLPPPVFRFSEDAKHRIGAAWPCQLQ